jgi:hypothetical protein
MRTGAAVARTLWQAVGAFAPDKVADTYTAALATLESALRAHLEVEAFLWLHVTPRGFRVHKTLLTTVRASWPRRLAADGIVRIALQARCHARELERCIEALQGHLRATCALDRDAVVGSQPQAHRGACVDEVLGALDAQIDLATASAAWPEGIARPSTMRWCCASTPCADLGASRHRRLACPRASRS